MEEMRGIEKKEKSAVSIDEAIDARGEGDVFFPECVCSLAKSG